MNAEFFEAIEDIEKEKGIPRSYMYDKINQAMLAAFRRDNPDCADNVEVILDEDKKRIDMVVKKTVVEEVEDANLEINLEAAKKISKRAKIGDIVGVPVETKKFGRIAAQAAKQVIIQGIREAERGLVFEEFTSKEHEILTGVVSHIEPRNGSVSIRIASNSEFTEAMLAANERIKTEELKEGDRIKVYVVEVRNSTRGPQVLISRTHPGLVKRLFELEVPEIYDGTVEIKSIAREAGSRTKMAVWSADPNVDPIGSCVGPKGGRVASIVNELGGEKIDIVKYSEDPEEYIAAALSPSEVVSVTMLDDGTLYSAETIEELAQKLGMDAQNLRAAVDGLNAAAKGEQTDAFGREKFGNTIEEGPFYATERHTRLHYTMGGLKIDAGAHVLDTQGQMIPGLYAAGETTGGIHGTYRVGAYALTDILVMGRTAGANAAETAK